MSDLSYPDSQGKGSLGTSLNTGTENKDIAAIWNFNMYSPKSQNLITVGHVSRATSQ